MKEVILMKFIKLFSVGMVALSLSACGGGDSSSDNATGCLAIEGVDGGVNVTNNCDDEVNVAFFDPLYRFSLEEDETLFLARTGAIRYGACEDPLKPREDGDDSFICTL